MFDFEEIKSRDNSTVKNIIKLQSSAKERKKQGLFVIEGLRILKDAYDNGIKFNILVFTEEIYNKFPEIVLKFHENSDKTIRMPEDLFKKLADTTTPQGILAVCKIESKPSYEIDKNGRYIAFENISDPANLGAAARTGEALGISGIILSSDGLDPYSPKCLRVSMGALLRIPVIILNDFPGEINKLGLKTYALVLKDYDFKLSKKEFSDGCIALIGNEANGLSDYVIKNSDYRVNIDMKGNVESLNASVAASIVMWEMLK